MLVLDSRRSFDANRHYYKASFRRTVVRDCYFEYKNKRALP